MSRKIITDRDAYVVVRPRKYGFFHFIADIVMVVVTGGLWLIYIFVREMRESCR